MMHWLKSGILICMIFGTVLIAGCDAHNANANPKAPESTDPVSAADELRNTGGAENLQAEEAAPSGQEKPEGKLPSPSKSSPETDTPEPSDPKADAPDAQPPAKETGKADKPPAASAPPAQK